MEQKAIAKSFEQRQLLRHRSVDANERGRQQGRERAARFREGHENPISEGPERPRTCEAWREATLHGNADLTSHALRASFLMLQLLRLTSAAASCSCFVLTMIEACGEALCRLRYLSCRTGGSPR